MFTMYRLTSSFVLGSALLLAACEDPAKGKAAAEVAEPVKEATPAMPAATTVTKYEFSEANSKVEFVGAKVSLKHDGSFKKFSGSVEVPDGNVEKGSVQFEVMLDSVETDTEKLTGHLKSADFFDVEQFPELVFQSTSVRRNGDDRFELAGDLTIRDVTQPVVLKGEFSGPVKSPFGDRRAGFSLSGEIDREAFGLTWNVAMETGGVLVGKTVKLNIEAEVAEQAAEAEGAESESEAAGG